AGAANGAMSPWTSRRGRARSESGYDDRKPCLKLALEESLSQSTPSAPRSFGETQRHRRPGVGRDPGKDEACTARIGLDSGLRRSDGGGNHIISRTVRFDSAILKYIVVPA